MTTRRAFFAVLTLTLSLCTASDAATSLGVKLGWGGRLRLARWTPVIVTLSDPLPRNVLLELYVHHDPTNGMRIRQGMAIGPQEQTFVLYVPFRHYEVDRTSIVIRDAKTFKKLADYPGGPFGGYASATYVEGNSQFVGISGRRTVLKVLESSWPGAFQSAFLDPALLPSVAKGFDALDVLILNAPELSALATDQQQAMADWVRGGGKLVLWPGDGPVPLSGPLMDVLPCYIGTTTTFDVNPEERKAAGLSPRFARLTGRSLEPRDGQGIETVPLLGKSDLLGYRRRLGFGRIFVSPIGLAELQFGTAAHSAQLWRTALHGMAKIPDIPDAGPAQPPQYFGALSKTTQREAVAVRQVSDLLGDVPGAGSFGFSYVAFVLMGLMVVVGPVDWFVLKKLGRQPWTWVTTSGWIVLVTLGALYIGHLFKSGDLHYRTFQLVDQVDGLGVSRMDVVGMYSPKTDQYELETSPDGWWEPAAPTDSYFFGSSGGSEVAFHQTYRDNRPEPMLINVWNLRFLQAETLTRDEPPLVEATLRIEPASGGGKPAVVGRIRNVGPTGLKSIMVRTKAGWCHFDGFPDAVIPPGQSIEVRATPYVNSDVVPKNKRPQGGYQYPDDRPVDLSKLSLVGADIAARRSEAIDALLGERDDLACVYAECVDPEPVVKLKGKSALEKHFKIVRALVKLER